MNVHGVKVTVTVTLLIESLYDVEVFLEKPAWINVPLTLVRRSIRTVRVRGPHCLCSRTTHLSKY